MNSFTTACEKCENAMTITFKVERGSPATTIDPPGDDEAYEIEVTDASTIWCEKDNDIGELVAQYMEDNEYNYDDEAE